MSIHLTGLYADTEVGRNYQAVDKRTGKLVVVELPNDVVRAYPRSRVFIEAAASAKFEAGDIAENGNVLITGRDLQGLIYPTGQGEVAEAS
ncbi:hypothetical protein ATER59S_00970 [Aquamicrobium terrae]